MLVLDHLINAVMDGQGLSHEKLVAMESQYNLSSTRNVEIAFRPGSGSICFFLSLCECFADAFSSPLFLHQMMQVVPARLPLQMARLFGRHGALPWQARPGRLCEAFWPAGSEMQVAAHRRNSVRAKAKAIIYSSEGV